MHNERQHLHKKHWTLQVILRTHLNWDFCRFSFIYVHDFSQSPQRTDHQWDLKKRASWLFSPLHTPKSSSAIQTAGCSSASFSISDRDFSFLSLIRCFDVQHFVSLSIFCHFQGNEASYALDMCSHCKYHLMSLHHVITSNTVGTSSYKHLLISTSVDPCICIHFEYIKAGENLIEQTSEKSECGLGFW